MARRTKRPIQLGLVAVALLISACTRLPAEAPSQIATREGFVSFDPARGLV